MRWLTAVATTLLTTSAFVAPPRTRLHALAAVTTDDAIEQKLDSWLLDNLGSCAVPIDDDDDDAFELCSVDSPTAVWKSNQCVGCTRQFFTKSFPGADAAVLARSSCEEPASPRHRAGVASMAWRTTRRFSTNAP